MYFEIQVTKKSQSALADESVDQTKLRDLVVIGAGPSGLAAAVYGASEGLDVLLLESRRPGWFELKNRKLFGISHRNSGPGACRSGVFSKIRCTYAHCQGQTTPLRPQTYVIEVDSGARIHARTIVIATGAEYRRPPCKNLSRFEGAGLYYGATFMEAQLCGGEEVVGGGNSAGQAAVFLAQTTKRVHMLVRSAGLAESMSRYLIHRRSHTQRSWG